MGVKQATQVEQYSNQTISYSGRKEQNFMKKQEIEGEKSPNDYDYLIS